MTHCLAGLALLVGTAALFPLVALIALLVAGRQWRAVVLVGGFAVLVVALGVAPFLVVDRRDTMYSLLTWRGSEQIGGNSVWSVFTVDAVARVLPHAVAALLLRLDTPLMMVLAERTQRSIERADDVDLLHYLSSPVRCRTLSRDSS